MRRIVVSFGIALVARILSTRGLLRTTSRLLEMVIFLVGLITLGEIMRTTMRLLLISSNKMTATQMSVNYVLICSVLLSCIKINCMHGFFSFVLRFLISYVCFFNAVSYYLEVP